MHFKTWLESGRFGDTCSLYAICDLFPIDRKVAIPVLEKHGLGKHGIRLANLTLALDELGISWHIKNSRLGRGLTPKQLRESGGLPGKHIIVVHGHVMPMANGNISNFCGFGDEPIRAIVTVE